MGMLSLRHALCKLPRPCVVAHAGTTSLSDDLPMSDIARGDRKELSLFDPESKLAAFVTSFCTSLVPDQR